MKTFIVNMKDGKVYEIEAEELVWYPQEAAIVRFQNEDGKTKGPGKIYPIPGDIIASFPSAEVESVIRKDLQKHVRLTHGKGGPPEAPRSPVSEAYGRCIVALRAVQQEFKISGGLGGDYQREGRHETLSNATSHLVMVALGDKLAWEAYDKAAEKKDDKMKRMEDAINSVVEDSKVVSVMSPHTFDLLTKARGA